MTHYRVYWLTALGHIEAGEDLEARDDDEAIGLVQQRLGRHRMELWEGARLVREFRPPGDLA